MWTRAHHEDAETTDEETGQCAAGTRRAVWRTVSCIRYHLLRSGPRARASLCREQYGPGTADGQGKFVTCT